MGEESPKVVLVVAGFDPSGGAGVLADVKTIAAHRLHGVATVTALTVQSTQGVRSWETVGAMSFGDTLEALVEDTPPAATKIGMLGSGKIAAVIADFLECQRPPNVVLDPVLRSSSGADLIDQDGFAVLRNRLLGLSDVVTPNLDEASRLAELDVHDLLSMRAAAEKLCVFGARNLVVKGGHLLVPTDLLAESQPDGSVRFREYPGERINIGSTHGTGCAFSTSLACNLALGKSLSEAVLAAKEYVAAGLRLGYTLGKGSRLIDHSYAWGR